MEYSVVLRANFWYVNKMDVSEVIFYQNESDTKELIYDHFKFKAKEVANLINDRNQNNGYWWEDTGKIFRIIKIASSWSSGSCSYIQNALSWIYAPDGCILGHFMTSYGHTHITNFFLCHINLHWK